ncbi:MAG: DegT/DnrJ/EryC1/StrS family aminotransferase [Chloroflexi bacterium]|nr:DegT/DnrJ/EryC1/StrS family aminotransferase [Chloroflexota bacterium]
MQRALAARGIETRVYYPLPVHQQPPNLHRFSNDVSLPGAESASAEVFSLPVHLSLTQEELDFVAGAGYDRFPAGCGPSLRR